jgi:hypothetical protein
MPSADVVHGKGVKVMIVRNADANLPDSNEFWVPCQPAAQDALVPACGYISESATHFKPAHPLNAQDLVAVHKGLVHSLMVGMVDCVRPMKVLCRGQRQGRQASLDPSIVSSPGMATRLGSLVLGRQMLKKLRPLPHCDHYLKMD